MIDMNPVLSCEQWEALLADKMDGSLAPEAEAAFTEHSLSCEVCKVTLEEARQGHEWLKLLEGRTPAAPVDLLSKILANTQGAGQETDFVIGAGVAAGLPGPPAERWSIPFLPGGGAGMAAARGAQNARLLMTAGMAFFSVALTLSVAGVRLTSVHAAELRPQVVQANVTRSFYGTKKQVVSFYDNLRLVYEVESKMHELRRETDQAPPAAPVTKPAPAQAAPAGKLHGAAAPQGGAAKTGGEVVERGWPVLASLAVEPPLAGSRQANRLAAYELGTPRPQALPWPGRPLCTAVAGTKTEGAPSKERIRI